MLHSQPERSGKDTCLVPTARMVGAQTVVAKLGDVHDGTVGIRQLQRKIQASPDRRRPAREGLLGALSVNTCPLRGPSRGATKRGRSVGRGVWGGFSASRCRATAMARSSWGSAPRA